MSSRRSEGFTLLEIMMAVALVAVLASIAIPSYQQYGRKAKRAEAIASLLNMQLQQEKWRANNNSYNATASQIGAPGSAYYSFSVTNAGASSYTLIAAAIAGTSQVKDKQSGTSCSTLSIDQSGTRTPAVCWR